jgi:hypothetical protein
MSSESLSLWISFPAGHAASSRCGDQIDDHPHDDDRPYESDPRQDKDQEEDEGGDEPIQERVFTTADHGVITSTDLAPEATQDE